MQANSPSTSTRAWPTAMVTLAVLALVVSAVSLGAALYKSSPTTVVGATPTKAPAPAPAFTFTAEPSPDFHARDPEAPPPGAGPPGTVHEVTLEVTEKQLEIAPGVSQLMWTFGGEVPAPVLRGKVGDTFRITVVNHGTTGHSIDFHASKVAPNVMMKMIDPGKSAVYTFTADHSGIFMYHCGTPPVLEHIGMGMYGAIIIDPPNLPPVAHEYVLVQSDLYREADPSQPVDLNKLLNEQWDAVVWNGYVNQYAARPIHVDPNQRVRVWVMDDGPSENSSFHVIGTIFDTVYKEGAYLLQPDAAHGGGQALDLQPAQGGFVEFDFAVPGKYPFVTHKFASASKGAVGVFLAGSVPPAPAG